jgi:ribulose-phosphate 3-epimerase
VVRSLKRIAHVPLDVHLMITDPDRYIDAFASAGASMISVHVEVPPPSAPDGSCHQSTRRQGRGRPQSSDAGHRTRTDRRRCGLRAGDVGEPGFGGQSSFRGAKSKVREVRAALDRAGNTHGARSKSTAAST